VGFINFIECDYEKPMRTLAQLCPMFCRLRLAQPQPQNKARIRCRAVAFPKMFLQAEIGTALITEDENAEQLLFLNCLSSEKQEHRFLLL
jgi:hypothetical protein